MLRFPSSHLSNSVIFSSDVGLLKPDPAIYFRSLSELGVEAGRALFVDDLPENVAGAQAVGMAALLHRDWGKSVPSIEAWLSMRHWIEELV